ncbi:MULTISPECIES: hypothetical protein [Enterobacter]|nr:MULTISPECIES: hypothetical protein [Enterobacter]EKZ5806859.1 hypothetical protein [Klebsiella variicola]MCU2313830.1 hypothetical protein [Enterobacter hormaechei subsp. steigerwaltii]EKS6583098.1 hypothetical protein [Enterobacter hormaechei]EKZ5807373.1 hypothetical protein [Klebsiella variicola]ELC6573605.1 hypothetical protein [Enterobacter hormaechei]
MAAQQKPSSSSTIFGSSQINTGSSSVLQIDAAWMAFEKMLEKRLEELKPKSPSQIKASGDSRNKTIVISALVIILAIIVIYIGAIYIIDSQTGKEFTSSLMPVITAIISGVFGYLSGEKASK